MAKDLILKGVEVNKMGSIAHKFQSADKCSFHKRQFRESAGNQNCNRCRKWNT